MNDEELHALTGRDIERIKRLLDAFEGGRLDPAPSAPAKTVPPPKWTVLALADDGVAAADGDVPGSGAVSIWYAEAATNTYADSGFDATAYNPTGVAIPAGAPLELYRDPRSGKWWAMPYPERPYAPARVYGHTGFTSAPGTLVARINSGTPVGALVLQAISGPDPAAGIVAPDGWTYVGGEYFNPADHTCGGAAVFGRVFRDGDSYSPTFTFTGAAAASISLTIEDGVVPSVWGANNSTDTGGPMLAPSVDGIARPSALVFFGVQYQSGTSTFGAPSGMTVPLNDSGGSMQDDYLLPAWEQGSTGASGTRGVAMTPPGLFVAFLLSVPRNAGTEVNWPQVHGTPTTLPGYGVSSIGAGVTIDGGST